MRTCHPLGVGNLATTDTKHLACKHQKAVRLVKKVRLEAGRWQFVTVPHSGNRSLWDPRPGAYFLEWWEGKQRRREAAGMAPSEALEVLRRKRLELAGP